MNEARTAAERIDILDDGRATTVDAVVDGGRMLVGAAEFAAATGWSLSPEGLCRGAVCVPLRAHPDVVAGGRIDAAAVAAPLRRAVLVDPAARVVAYAPAADTVAAGLAGRHAADFTLPRFDGTPFTFSTIGRKKKLLLAWASW